MDSYSDADHSDNQANRSGDLVANLHAALTRARRLGRFSIFEDLLMRFSPGERLLLYVLSVTMACSAVLLVVAVDRLVSVDIPTSGGSLTEGEVGPARFINPILTLSSPDQDLTALVYSGLMRQLPDGTFVPDLASSYSISPDGTTYTFKIRPNAKFQDGTPVTAADVLFTINAVQDVNLKSPQQANWSGVTVSSPDTLTVVFTLTHAYAPFIDNTTLGIVPKHLWQNVSDEEFPFDTLNTHPIGSGPYRVSSVSNDSTGSATRYELVPFTDYSRGRPYLNKITFLFYPDDSSMEAAFDAGRIDAMAGISPLDLSNLTRHDAALLENPLPRVFGIFFNQGHNPVLADASVRAALNAAVDKQQIVNTVLHGYGVTLDGPIPPNTLSTLAPATPIAFSSSPGTSATSSPDESSFAAAARSILEKGGWTFNTTDNVWQKGKQNLTFTLATADEPELVATTNAVAAFWSAAGIKVTVQVYPLSELNSTVIRPRNYDAVLFGEVVGPQLDLYAFWHSSQRNNPGLNLAMYANEKTDVLLSQARATTDTTARNKLYTQFATDIEKDQPAVFLYAPDFLYIVPTSIKGISIGALTTAADRFSSVDEWYTQTQSVWNIFAGTAR
ncbi:MAG TPA: peptide ABC transporter substrate-binding protein [Candidatus Paceibacterota bacterium]|nr:peptide ABC transporter substrate-binding protein [Candidatus Paceibacterota bacterium]